jgi:hypothetical protein
MPSLGESVPQILLIITAVVSFAAGVYCLVRFGKTRKNVFLILGLLFTFLLPGICVYLVAHWLVQAQPPTPIITYGPPPDHNVP